MKQWLIGLSIFWSAHTVWASDIPHSNATVLLYHHVSSETPASTSVSISQFKQHLDYIEQHHTVLPLTEIVEAAQNNSELPANALAITFDDGYANILENAHPLLRNKQMPYTIFINPALIGKQPQQLHWSQVKTMAKENVLFANHTQQHLHLLEKHAGESEESWLKRTVHDIESAEAELQAQLGYSLKYVAYPFGEYNQQLATTLLAKGYIGFGQHSGAMAAYSDFGALPRFPAAGIYANLDSLKTKMASLAMPLKRPVFEPMQQLSAQPTVTLELTGNAPKPAQLTCFYNNQPLPLSVSEHSVTFNLPAPLPAGRSRVNCTAPSALKQRFYWYSQPFFVANAQGQYPD